MTEVIQISAPFNVYAQPTIESLRTITSKCFLIGKQITITVVCLTKEESQNALQVEGRKKNQSKIFMKNSQT